MSKHERKVSWIDLREEPKGQKANLFEDTVELRIDDWVLGAKKKSEKVTLEVYEQDSDDSKSDLLATFTGKIVKHKKGFKFTWSKCKKTKASKETVVLLANAFRFKAAGGKKTQALDILGAPDEGEGQTYDVSFRIKAGGATVFTCEDPKKLYAEDDKCILRIPIMGQQMPNYQKDPPRRTTYKRVEKEKSYFSKADTIRYDYEAVRAEWRSCTREVPFLNTSFDGWPTGGTLEHELEMLTVDEAIERGNVLNLTARQIVEDMEREAVDAAGEALDEAVGAGAEAGTDAEEAEAEESPPEESPPSEAPATVDKTVLNLRAYDHVLSPAYLPTYERLGAVETIQYGGCKLTSVANAMWYLGVFPKVLAGIAARDTEKALFPHYCGSKKTNKSSDPKRSSRKQCKETEAKGANVCAGCDHRKFDSNVPSDEHGRRQIPPLWFNVYLWWFILAHETDPKSDPKNQPDPGYACAKKRTLTTDRGNFKIDKLIDVWGSQLGLEWAKSGGSLIKLVTFKTSDVQEHGRQVRGLLREGLPIYVSLRHRNHINLIIGFKRTKAGEWRYLFWDPGGSGGFKVWSKLQRANVYSAFKRRATKDDSWQPEWEEKPASL